ncbi:hypothetical protein O0L34_g3627 [Tuta absoluta]|nr:hypothetical protein O0L34_g3627 [Tuta absoluta]
MTQHNDENIVNGFKATGLYPFNPDIFQDEAFAPSILSKIQAIPNKIEDLPNESDSEALIQDSLHLLINANISDDDVDNREEGRETSSHPRRISIDSDETVCEDGESNSNLPLLISAAPSNNIVLDEEHQENISDDDIRDREEGRETISHPRKIIDSDETVCEDGESNSNLPFQISAAPSNNIVLEEEHQDPPFLRMVTPEKSQTTPTKSPQPGCSGMQTARPMLPILQSSDTELDYENMFNMQAFLHRQKHPTRIHIYLSDEDDIQKDDKENNIKQNDFEPDDDNPLVNFHIGNQDCFPRTTTYA